ncbi:MAG: hypothetical protein AAGI67_02920 [Pseudomonadota bacterium]
MRVLIAAGLLVSATVQADDYCEFRKSLDVAVPAADLTTLDLTAGAGNLEINGQAGADEVTVIATACASSQRILDGLSLDQRISSDTLRLETRENDGLGWGIGNRYAGITLDIVVPERFAVVVDDGSGAAVIRGVASVDVEDGSGNLEIANIGGDVTVDDNSGSLSIRDALGRVYLRDGSGGIKIVNVEQDVFIEEDGSGSIEIRDVGLDVVVEEDGSGSIEVSQVGGDVRIDRDGSGGIRVADVEGGLTVDRDGNGGITHRNVAGAVSIPETRKNRKRM